MEPEEPPDNKFATPDEIRQAIEALTKEDTARLKKAAVYCLAGTEYQDPLELINEAVIRTINGALGYEGRHWPKSVNFMAFMIMTIRGIANDSRESPLQTMTERLEAISGEDGNADDALDVLGHSNPCVVEQAIEIEESEARRALAKIHSDAIDAHFANDDDVNWIIMGQKDGQSATEIQNLSGMSTTQYETARKRFRRGLEKLFPSRRKS